jgi:FkbM family methyltransferase
VHAFEPLPELALRLSAGFALDRRVHVHQVALSDRLGTAELRVPGSQDGLDWGLGTIEVANSLSGQEVRRFRVPMRTLDSYKLRNVGFIKIDVEGHELAVLRGSTALIKACHPAFLIEAQEMHQPGSLARVTAFLSEAGYRGLFLCEGALHDISEFDLATHQAEDALDATLNRRPGRCFVYNFLFVTDTLPFRHRAAGLIPTAVNH